jgi:hypothetical protein
MVALTGIEPAGRQSGSVDAGLCGSVLSSAQFDAILIKDVWTADVLAWCWPGYDEGQSPQFPTPQGPSRPLVFPENASVPIPPHSPRRLERGYSGCPSRPLFFPIRQGWLTHLALTAPAAEV